jgi:transglycosylase-like protein with SLT domain
MSLATASLRNLIDTAAAHARLPEWNGLPGGVWLEALILQECGGNPDAVRYESAHDTTARGVDRPGVDDGDREDDKSYGLMQVLGSNVRRICGVPPDVALNYGFLRTPLIGMGFGLFILNAELQATGHDVNRALARYNGGPTGDHRDASGRLRRQEYVDGVRRWTDRVRHDRG